MQFYQSYRPVFALCWSRVKHAYTHTHTSVHIYIQEGPGRAYRGNSLCYTRRIYTYTEPQRAVTSQSARGAKRIPYEDTDNCSIFEGNTKVQMLHVLLPLLLSGTLCVCVCNIMCIWEFYSIYSIRLCVCCNVSRAQKGHIKAARECAGALKRIISLHTGSYMRDEAFCCLRFVTTCFKASRALLLESRVCCAGAF